MDDHKHVIHPSCTIDCLLNWPRKAWRETDIKKKACVCDVLTGMLISPLLTFSVTSCGFCPSTEQPIDEQVPRISRTAPAKSFARDRPFVLRAISMICSMVKLPWCFTNKTQAVWQGARAHRYHSFLFCDHVPAPLIP